MINFLIDFFSKVKFHAILAVFGFVLVLIAFFTPEDGLKLQFSPNEAPIYPLFVIGVLLVVFAIASFLLSEGLIGWGWLNPANIKRTDKGYTVPLGQATINVIYGRIQDCSTEKNSSVIVLPANEFFDDECINDRGSFLGAYMQSKFPNGIEEIQQLVETKLESLPSTEVEKEAGVLQQSYGLGESILLEYPLHSNERVILAAVTSKRAGEGLKAEIPSIFQAVRKIHRIMVDKRLCEVYSPIMGTGHGCLRTEVALFSMVLAWSEILCEPQGPDIEVNMILYHADETAKPKLSPRAVKRILQMATGMFRT